MNSNNYSSWNSSGSRDVEEVRAIKHFVWTYIVPSIFSFGLITNTVNVIVFSQRKRLKNNIYRYFHWHSIFDLVYVSLCLVRYIIKSPYLSQIHLSYLVQLYEAYVYIYFTSSVAIVMVLLELVISTKRLLIIMNIRLAYKLKLRTIIFIFSVISLVALLPLGVSIRVVDQRRCNYTFNFVKCANFSSHHPSFVLTHENISHRSTMQKLFVSVFIFRGLIAPLLLSVLNISIAYKFYQLCRRKNSLTGPKRSLTNQKCSYIAADPCTGYSCQSFNQGTKFSDPNVAISQAKKNLTLMIITINVCFIISNFSAAFSYLTYLVFSFSKFTTLITFMITKLILFSAHACSFFIYFSFDKMYRREFIAIFRLKEFLK